MISLVNTDIIQKAVEEATAVRQRAYAPYSGFRVGAAVVDADGGIHVGCNVENASYGLTQCAERAAISSAIASGQTNIVLCVVVTDTENTTTPCGACRQVLAEFGADMHILCTNLERHDQWHTLTELLPHSFNGTSLRR